MKRKLPKELSAYFRRRQHAQGSPRHWKKRFLRGDMIGREVLENFPIKTSKKLKRWMENNGGVYNCGCDAMILDETAKNLYCAYQH